MNETLDRAEILRRFEQWLDHALRSEDPPAGIPPEILDVVQKRDDTETGGSGVDAYGLWSAMTQVTQEVKLQGRAFQELNLTLASQSSRLGDEIRAVCKENEREAVRAAQRETERRCRKETLQALLDLQDRMTHGLESARNAVDEERETRAWARWLVRHLTREDEARTGEVLAALVKGYELSMERIAATIAEFHAREVRCQGEIFDPRRMNAVDTEETTAVPEGTVLEVYRSGFEWNGELLRPAQVKVARAPRASVSKEEEEAS